MSCFTEDQVAKAIGRIAGRINYAITCTWLTFGVFTAGATAPDSVLDTVYTILLWPVYLGRYVAEVLSCG